MSLRLHLADLPDIAVIYADLDGTLLGANGSILSDADGQPSLAAVEALVAARQAGIAVVAVTGRRAEQLAEDVAVLGLDGGIGEAGAIRLQAAVGADPQIVWGECPRELGPTPRAALETVDALSVISKHADGPVRQYQPWDSGRVGGYLLHGLFDAAAATDRLTAAGIGWAHVVDNGVTGGWADVPGVRAYHVIPRGVGKAAGVAEDLRLRALDPAEALAVGDSLEDQSMSTAVGTYVMVADGHGDVGANRFRSAHRNGQGVAEAIRACLDARRRA